MAQVERAQEERKANKRDRAARGRQSRRASAGDYQLTIKSWAILTALEATLMTVDGAVRVGLTRDRGALALGVYANDDYATEYIRPAEDLWTAAREIAEVWVPDGAMVLAQKVEEIGLGAWIIDL